MTSNKEKSNVSQAGRALLNLVFRLIMASYMENSSKFVSNARFIPQSYFIFWLLRSMVKKIIRCEINFRTILIINCKTKYYSDSLWFKCLFFCFQAHYVIVLLQLLSTGETEKPKQSRTKIIFNT